MSFIRKIKGNMEPRKWLRLTELILFAALLVASLTLFSVGIARVNRDAGDYDRTGATEVMRRLSPDDPDYAEDYDAEENRICTVTYRGESGNICRVDYSPAELVSAVRRCADFCRNDRAGFTALAKRDMACDFSWHVPVKKYEELYTTLVG